MVWCQARHVLGFSLLYFQIMIIIAKLAHDDATATLADNLEYVVQVSLSLSPSRNKATFYILRKQILLFRNLVFTYVKLKLIPESIL